MGDKEVIGRIICILIIVIVVSIIIFQFIYSKVVFYPYKEHFWKPPYEHFEFYLDEHGYKKPNGEIHVWYFHKFATNHLEFESSDNTITNTITNTNDNDKMLQNKNGKMILKENSHSKIIIFCHANAGNISHRDYIIEICRAQKCNLILFDYRGYGKSKGIPTAENIYKDGQAVYSYVRYFLKYPPERIIVWGESLGGAVAIYIARYNPCSYLIVMASFSSIDDIVLDRNISKFPKLMMKLSSPFIDTIPSKNHIAYVKCPTIIVHSIVDDLIPYESAKKMYHTIKHSDKKLITIKGGHASPDISNEDMRDILLFCHLDPNIDHSHILHHLKTYIYKPHIQKNGGMYNPGEIELPIANSRDIYDINYYSPNRDTNKDKDKPIDIISVKKGRRLIDDL
jgi:fermentation-respiration switch protein FrsA (DUF1100 family)